VLQYINSFSPLTIFDLRCLTDVSCGSSGKGAVNLADVVLKAVEEPVDFKFLYDVKVSAGYW